MYPFNLGWGAITPEGYDKEKNEAIFIYNLDLSRIKINLIISFVISRCIKAKLNLPYQCKQKIFFDFRGQQLNGKQVNEFYSKLNTEIEINEILCDFYIKK